MQGFVDIKLTFFLGYDRFLVDGSKLGHIFFKNDFFFLVLETDKDMSDISIGNTEAHEWLFAGS